jgi:hypothetical protein
MKHVIGLFACLVCGAAAAAVVALVAFPHVGGFSYAPPIVVFPILSFWVSLPTYVIAMVANSVFVDDLSKRKSATWGVKISMSATLAASIAVAAITWFKELHR